MGPRQDRRFTREGGRRKTELGQKLVPVGVMEGESGGRFGIGATMVPLVHVYFDTQPLYTVQFTTTS